MKLSLKHLILNQLQEREETKIVYTYYKQIIDEEHCLLTNELAQVSGFISTSEVSHTRLIGAALKKYMTDNNIDPLYFYSGQHRKLLSVFPRSVYQPTLEALYAKIGSSRRGSVEIDGKNYSYTLVHMATFGGAS